MAVESSRVAAVVGLIALLTSSSTSSRIASAKLADRGRVQSARKQRNTSQRRKTSSILAANNKNSDSSNNSNSGNNTPIPIIVEPEYRIHSIAGDANRLDSGSNNGVKGSVRGAKEVDMLVPNTQRQQQQQQQQQQIKSDEFMLSSSDNPFQRHLSSQLTGCCTTYSSYSATDMCSLYGEDCESGDTPSHDSGDESCEQVGLSFIGISFSVNTVLGNPYSYQLCDQFPMENIIDRSYEYVMSMDEDGWLVGGGYKSFDYSGKMP